MAYVPSPRSFRERLMTTWAFFSGSSGRISDIRMPLKRSGSSAYLRLRYASSMLRKRVFPNRWGRGMNVMCVPVLMMISMNLDLSTKQ